MLFFGGIYAQETVKMHYLCAPSKKDAGGSPVCFVSSQGAVRKRVIVTIFQDD